MKVEEDDVHNNEIMSLVIVIDINMFVTLAGRVVLSAWATTIAPSALGRSPVGWSSLLLWCSSVMNTRAVDACPCNCHGRGDRQVE